MDVITSLLIIGAVIGYAICRAQVVAAQRARQRQQRAIWAAPLNERILARRIAREFDAGTQERPPASRIADGR